MPCFHVEEDRLEIKVLNDAQEIPVKSCFKQIRTDVKVQLPNENRFRRVYLSRQFGEDIFWVNIPPTSTGIDRATIFGFKVINRVDSNPKPQTFSYGNCPLKVLLT